MNGRRLRDQCVGAPESTVLVVCYERDLETPDVSRLELVGHAFVTV